MSIPGIELHDFVVYDRGHRELGWERVMPLGSVALEGLFEDDGELVGRLRSRRLEQAGQRGEQGLTTVPPGCGREDLSDMATSCTLRSPVARQVLPRSKLCARCCASWGIRTQTNTASGVKSFSSSSRT